MLRSFLTLMVCMSLCQACIYSVAGNIDAGVAHIGDDTYALQRTGVTFGGQIIKVPLSLDIRINRERGESSGKGDLRKDFFQPYNTLGVSFWLPSESGLDPYVRYGSLSNEFEGFLDHSSSHRPVMQQKELALGVRHSRIRAAQGSCFYRYGYTLEVFASQSQVEYHSQLNSFGLRVSAFFDSGNHVGLPFFAGSAGNICLE